MKNLLALLVILGVSILFFWQFFLKGLLPIPSDALVGLYHPFRDFYAKEYPRGLPFKNFLITDPVRQQYEWRFLGFQLESQGQLPLWNPYNGLGMPLLANQQSALLSSFNFFFFFLPFSIAWSLQIFLTPLLGAWFLYMYLKELKLSSLASLFGGISFMFCGFMVAWLEWNTVAQSFIWLPFILWSIEKFSQSQNKKKRLVFVVLASAGLLSSLLAGHLQTFFYVGILTCIYFLLKTITLKKIKETWLFFVLFLVLFSLSSLLQLLPTFQLIALSARNIDVNWTSPGWFIPLQHLIQFITPDFFGNPATLNYWGVWNYGELVGYIGIIPLVFAFLGSIVARRKVVFFFVGVIVFSLLFSTANPLAATPFLWHIPFLSTSQPTRLLSLIDFSLIILSAFGIDSLRKIERKQIFSVLGFFSLVFLGVWMYLLIGNKLFSLITPENLVIAKRNSIIPTLLFLSSFFGLMGLTIFKNKKVYGIIIFLLFIFSLYDGLRFAAKFDPFTSPKFLFASTKTITFLQSHLDDYRYMTTDDRVLPPNVGAYYRLQSIEVYDPLYLQQYGELIAAMQRNKADISTPFGFNRIVTPHAFQSPLINLLGVKYVLSLEDINNKNFKKVFQEGQTKVYENMAVLPRAFFVKQTLGSSSKQETITKMFDSKVDLSKVAIVSLASPHNYVVGKQSVEISSYTPSKVVIQTRNLYDGFLILTDAYYPTWHVFIDERESQVFLTDYSFRGIHVPSGKHTIVFEDKLF